MSSLWRSHLQCQLADHGAAGSTGVPSNGQLESLLQEIEDLESNGDVLKQLADNWKSISGKTSKIRSILEADPKYIEAQKLLNQKERNECKGIFDEKSVSLISEIYEKVKIPINKDIKKFKQDLAAYMVKLDEAKKYIKNYSENSNRPSLRIGDDPLKKHVEVVKSNKIEEMKNDLKKIEHQNFSINETSTKNIEEKILKPVSRCVSSVK
ncbi:hypothetical protein QAD02_000047 [Eretmocerus hayati]|uniref:Uncharacterized protein n=1 Tax=Eretmocerus hayati TaxID=131215 RepID=A0ACC2NCV2_9HYME|nr:hypothetical protein QAD02_000047 [Eretmocerus hayati]